MTVKRNDVYVNLIGLSFLMGNNLIVVYQKKLSSHSRE